jgi:hypothetical protein
MPLDALQLLTDLERLLAGVDLARGRLEHQLESAATMAAKVFGADGAGLMLRVDGRLRMVGASNDAGRALERVQEELGQGPGIDATAQREVIGVADLNRSRWPELARALDGAGVRAVLSAPVWVRGRPAGNFNVFSAEAHDWDEDDVKAINAYAGVLTAYLRIALEAGDDSEVVARLRDTIGPAE